MEILTQLAEKYRVGLSSDSLERLAGLLEPRSYARGEMILDRGRTSMHMYIVERGLIRQFYYKDGRDITEHFSCEGDLATCLESLFLHEPTNLLVEAIEPSRLYLLDYAGLQILCESDPQIGLLYRRMLEYKLIVSQRKADSWRFESARERYERFLREYPAAAKRAAQADIASYLLMTPETLSRVRAGLL